MDITNNIFLEPTLNVLGLILLLIMRVMSKKRHFKKDLSFLISIFIFYFIVRILNNAFSVLEIESVNNAFYFAEILIFAFAAIKTVMYVLLEIFLHSRKGVEVPKIIQDVIFVLLYFVLFMLILKDVMNVNLTSILTTSAVLTMVLGLALQDNLGNLFSGLAIQLEKPFSIGEWVKFEDTTGKVKELTWRSVKLLTLENDLLIVPNNKIIKESVVNYSRPTLLHTSKFKIGVHYRHPPNKVKETILSVLKNEKDIAQEPKPHVRLIDFGDFSITYETRYFINNFNRILQIEDSIATKIWYAFKRDGIKIPFPIRDVNLTTITEEKEKRQEEEELIRRVALLRGIDFLSPLGEDEITKLAQSGQSLYFSAGETVIKEGDEGRSMYLILKGEVDISLHNKKGETKSVSTLFEKDFFGERSLMTGEKRNATVTALKDSTLFVIDKDNFKEVVSENKEILKQISEILTKRELELKEKRHEITKKVAISQIEENSNQLFKKIVKFFGF